MMMAYLKLLERDPAAAAAEIPYERKQSQAVQGTVIAHPLVVGEHYAPNTLLERMITESDNESAYLLYRFVGDELAGEVYTELGLPVPFANQDYNVRVRDYATFFRILYNATYLSPESSERALELLTRSDFDKGISAGIPAGIPIANKFGERDYGRAGDSQLHDCGIVYAPKRPYMLCIMTQGSGIERLSEVIRDISAAVYEYSITY
jgi:beta-lactamase class A